MTPLHLPLDQMSLTDKLAAMELLWEDLSSVPNQIPSPAWHLDELARRRQLSEQGLLQTHDWDVVVARMKAELRENPPH